MGNLCIRISPRRLKLKRVLYVLVACLLLIIVIPYDIKPHNIKASFHMGPPKGSSRFITTWPRNLTESEYQYRVHGNKTILIWTDYFDSQTWHTHSRTFESCLVKTCRMTSNKEEISSSDAVLMNIRNIYSLSDLPSVRRPLQVWIIHGSEPPYYVYVNERSLNNVFNWTSWYRSDADIFSPYGHYIQQNPSLHNEGMSQESFKHNYMDPKTIIPERNDSFVEDPFSLHDLSVFWAASNCLSHSQRYRLVAQLRNFLSVHTYGFCGSFTCQQSTRECDILLRRYKFVLALENGYCRDYVTEKYWGALHRWQIPIVSGGADYSKMAIPGSYIDVNDFDSVEDLARFVDRVGSDRRLYNAFFAWRVYYRPHSYGISNWCQICAALHDDTRAAQVYSSFDGWLAEDTCPLHSIFQTMRWARQYMSFRLFGI